MCSDYVMDEPKAYPWKLFFVLLAASLLGAAAVIPYQLELSREVVQRVALALPLWFVITVQFAQTAVLLAVATGIGLLISRKLALGGPIVAASGDSQMRFVTRRTLIGAAIAGAAIAVVIIATARIVFLPRMPQLAAHHSEATIMLWKRLLACFYGAVDEEILMRLFLLSGVLWVIGKIMHIQQVRNSSGAFWAANWTVALVFGLAHLPAAGMIMPMNAATTLYIMLLNGVAALVFGYVFWSRGLESAMLAHFSADVVLHVIAPAVVG